MIYVLNWLGQPVASSAHWPTIHATALANGLAVNALGCIFALVPGATIDKIRTH